VIRELRPSFGVNVQRAFDEAFAASMHEIDAEIAREHAGSIVCAIYFDYGRALAWWVREPTKPMRFDLAWPPGVMTVGPV
jgi:hypothetical protein